VNQKQEPGPLGPTKCPKCQSVRILPIIYGLPLPEDLVRGREPDHFVGGCLPQPGNPTWGCRECGHEWGEWRPPV
jgi:hypothetical protein